MSLSKDLSFEDSLRYLNHSSLTSSKSSHLLLTEFFNSRPISEWSMAKNNRSVGLHRIFQYPAMMVPEVQQKIVKAFTAIDPQIQNLVDPFMGGGTAITAGLYNGLSCHGQDINPLSVLVSKVKTSNYNLKSIREKKAYIDNAFKKAGHHAITVDFLGRDRWFEKKVSSDISRLREAIIEIPGQKYRQFFWVLLAETIRLSSNDRTSTYKLHRRHVDDIEKRAAFINVFEIFTQLYGHVCEDLKEHSTILRNLHDKNLKVSIRLADSTQGIAQLNNCKYDLVVTSPPYGDNKTTVPYGQHSYLPLQWIPLNDIDKSAEKTLLSTTSRIDAISLGGNLKEMDSKVLDSLFKKSRSLKKIHGKLKRDPQGRSKKIVNFFADFDKVLSSLKDVSKKDSYQVFVIGNRTVGSLTVPNNAILQELLEANDFKFLTEFHREIHNKRMPRKNDKSNTMNKESIVVSCKGHL